MSSRQRGGEDSGAPTVDGDGEEVAWHSNGRLVGKDGCRVREGGSGGMGRRRWRWPRIETWIWGEKTRGGNFGLTRAVGISGELAGLKIGLDRAFFFAAQHLKPSKLAYTVNIFYIVNY
jgi:hypothetical protein